jgi:4-hydroxythreonine-4-phosphate dehydrogenase
VSSADRVALAITMGDPAGIGPEICAAVLEKRLLPDGIVPILVGSVPRRLSATPAVLELETLSPEADPSSLQPGKAYIVDTWPELTDMAFGRSSAAAGNASLSFLEAALALVRGGIAQGLVTAPISKESWRLAGIGYPGHTEYLRESTGVDRTEMLFYADGLWVALFTAHCSLAESIAALKRESLAGFIAFVVRELERFGWRGLRVGVAGLNPHAGEGGMFGREEIEVIAPAVADCRAAGINALGPFPADSLFHLQTRRNFDLIVALYHDQGLIPVKTLAFYEAVNVTLGLPFVRTSPAHGAAFDIAGRGKARPEGLAAAVRVAADLVRRRSQT